MAYRKEINEPLLALSLFLEYLLKQQLIFNLSRLKQMIIIFVFEVQLVWEKSH